MKRLLLSSGYYMLVLVMLMTKIDLTAPVKFSDKQSITSLYDVLLELRLNLIMMTNEYSSPDKHSGVV